MLQTRSTAECLGRPCALRHKLSVANTNLEEELSLEDPGQQLEAPQLETLTNDMPRRRYDEARLILSLNTLSHMNMHAQAICLWHDPCRASTEFR